jgi:hypothetical protein
MYPLVKSGPIPDTLTPHLIEFRVTSGTEAGRLSYCRTSSVVRQINALIGRTALAISSCIVLI